jgi:hypothetical protein
MAAALLSIVVAVSEGMENGRKWAVLTSVESINKPKPGNARSSRFSDLFHIYEDLSFNLIRTRWQPSL